MADGVNLASDPGALRGGVREWDRALETWDEKPRDPLRVADRQPMPRGGAGLLRATVDAQRALREAAVAASEAAMRARSMAVVLDETLAALAEAETVGSGMAAIGAAMPTAVGLSPREREVLALVAEGRTNKAIAEALYVSPNTVKTHVASLLSKLNAVSRAQLAAMGRYAPVLMC